VVVPLVEIVMVGLVFFGTLIDLTPLFSPAESYAHIFTYELVVIVISLLLGTAVPEFVAEEA
jgi:hypothetical protein